MSQPPPPTAIYNSLKPTAIFGNFYNKPNKDTPSTPPNASFEGYLILESTGNFQV